ncbi:TMEM175 family protein [Gordonia hydrophobica]|uniref:TMEM175 family protein n=1 Tax=Gordonia hydrophobica TaxID=40516 RepID=A0ABZ2U1S5_9ACTN|nr:TMEM175 family protein [Gordonia hydrophobica]MBM7366575.1 putative membrane protein [Gordonia hydrophobica]
MVSDDRERTDFSPTDSPEFGRGVSYFDAVYGFAATLLIANVDSVPPEAWRDLHALLSSDVLGQLVGFFLSFAVIALFWRVSVRCLRAMTGLDGPTTAISLVATALIVLIPFTTQGISDPASADLPLPTAVYAVNVALAALAHSAVFVVAATRGLLRQPLDAARLRAAMLDYALTPAIFLLSIPLAFWVDPAVAQLSWLSLAVLLPLSGRRAERG